jgi:competence protein ComGC
VPRRSTPTHDPRAAGFVLSELVLVVSVVLVLLLIIVVSVRGIHDSTAEGDCQSQVRALRVAGQRYLAETGRNPISKEELVRADLLDPADAPDYRIESGGPAEEPRLRPQGRCA